MAESAYYLVRVGVDVTDGKATRAEIEDALCNELDQDIETAEGAVLRVMVFSASFDGRRKK